MIFNLLPIIPLDGSKLINIILNKLFNFRLSYYLLIVISFILSIFLVFRYNNIVILSFILYELILYIKNKNIIFNRFILEKYLYKNNYKKYKYIPSINKLYRNKKHLIKYNNIYLSEKTYINNIYKDNMDKA